MKVVVRVTWVSGVIMFVVAMLCCIAGWIDGPPACTKHLAQNPYACGLIGPLVSTWYIYAIMAIVVGVLLLALAGLLVIIVSIWRHFTAKSPFARSE